MNPKLLNEKFTQAQALKMFVNMGYEYISPQQAISKRGGNYSQVLLSDVLDEQLRKLNQFELDGGTYEISGNNVSYLISELSSPEAKGLTATNKGVYQTLVDGKSVKEFVKGREFFPQSKYIDFKNPENNKYHVTQEYEVTTADGRTRKKLDVVAFVNGIPFVAIECKAATVKEGLEVAKSDIAGYEKKENIEYFFYYTQVHIACNSRELSYATTGTSSSFWTVWREQEFTPEQIAEVQNKPISEELTIAFLGSDYEEVGASLNSELSLTEQSSGLYSLCHPDRLMELVQKHILFDGGIKKLSRYQQYYATKKTLERIKHKKKDGNRKGGVIWHTQGSGKSLTMVLIAKALALDTDIQNPRVLIVTDRIQLDKQIHDTFENTKEGLTPKKATSGKNLLKLLENEKYEIVTTVLAKFNSLLHKKKSVNSENIFVLIDESHRSQYGLSHSIMKAVLPKATYIGFTGTPLNKGDKDTAEKFGGFIHKYTLKEAEADGVIVPLLYENRLIVNKVAEKAMDRKFGQIAEDLTEYQQEQLKKTYSTEKLILSTDNNLMEIANDIKETYLTSWKGTKFKAQVATNSKRDAIMLKRFLDELAGDRIKSEVIISNPQEKEGEESGETTNEDREKALIQKHWKEMMAKYGGETYYNDMVKNSFKDDPDGIEIIICVDKLLTGFDAPVNTVLFNLKNLKDHNLLQAVARVNRVCEGKEYGYIIDYNGILGNMTKALDEYSALAGYDKEDIEGTVTDVAQFRVIVAEDLKHLEEMFVNIDNKEDVQLYVAFLDTKDKRDEFSDRLRTFGNSLHVVMNEAEFHQNHPHLIKKYRNDYEFYTKLNITLKVTYSEYFNMKEFEPRMRALLNNHVFVEGIESLTDGSINLSDREKVEEFLERIGTKNDVNMPVAIAHNAIKECTENMDKDPVFYKKLSELIREAIEKFRQKKIDDLQFARAVSDLTEKLRCKKIDGIPSALEHNENAQTLYRNIKSDLLEKKKELSDERLIELALNIESILDEKTIVDWKRNEDIKKELQSALDDIFYDLIDNEGLELSHEELDKLNGNIIQLAENRY